ncbi:hypothetical protein LQZ19_00190 [Treponema primitia]|uniref:hypothetical protein n=1 Tax=Treponema primitia TaxID=88058 RepID=UPI00397F3227
MMSLLGLFPEAYDILEGLMFKCSASLFKCSASLFKCSAWMFKCRRKRVQVLPFFCSSISASLFKCAGIHVQMSPQNAVIINEAYRRGDIETNIIHNIKPLAEHSKERGVLTVKEATQVLNEQTWKLVWSDQWMHYIYNLTAAQTRMRFRLLVNTEWDT